jgi:nucleoside-diphosphate-sugar epimerase
VRPPFPADDAALEDALSLPQARAAAALRDCPGDVVVLGAGGKMGPSLCRMLTRLAGATGDARRVIAVSRFTDASLPAMLASAGVEVVQADLSDFDAYWDLPDAPNVIYMAGRKFGTTGSAALTWHANTVLPAMAANRYESARIVAFSTGNVYPLSPVTGGGSVEGDPLAPVGDYAASAVGRERVFEYASRSNGTRVALIRLNYAVDLRYGVLVDVARKVFEGAVIDLAMGQVNCIWQGDANAIAIAALANAAAPPFVLNVTGPEMLAVRDVANFFGTRFGKPPQFVGVEAPDALLSNTDRMQALLGPPAVDASTLMEWVARWVAGGGTSLGRATHFEERGGSF